MRHDLEAIVPALPPARALTSIVDDAPGDAPLPADGATTDVVVLGDLAPTSELDTTTATIARVERGTRRRWRRRLGIVALVAAVAASAWGVWTYLVPSPFRRAFGRRLAGRSCFATSFPTSGSPCASPTASSPSASPPGAWCARNPSRAPRSSKARSVTRVPSLGPPPVKAPKVEGMTLERATTQLERAGPRSEGRRASLPRRDRRRQREHGSDSRAGGRQAARVELVRSKGHAPVEIPKVAGLSEAQASERLQAAGFTGPPRRTSRTPSIEAS